MPPPPSTPSSNKAMRFRDSLATKFEPRNGGPSGVFVILTSEVVAGAGIALKNICGPRAGFNPVASSAWGGKVPSGRKFSAEAKTIAEGLSEES